MVNESEMRTEKGMSLSRGPALVLGTILLAAGLYFLYRQHAFPKFSNFPDGTARVDGKVLFGIFGANGWTGMLTAVGGGLLLFGAAQHLLAKTMSLIVGVALGAAAIIALVSGDALGMAAANGWTELGWGASAAILLFNATVPRRRRKVVAGGPVADRTVAERDTAHVRRREVGAAGAGAAVGAVAEHRHDERTAEHSEDRTAVHDGTAGESQTVAQDRVGSEDRTAVHGSETGGPAPDGTAAPRGEGGSGAVSEEERLRASRED